VAVVVYLAAGFRPTAHSYYWQLLDLELLRESLAASLWFLHAQPPLMNLTMGLVMKASAATGYPPHLVAQVPLQLFGFGCAVGAYGLARALGLGRAVAAGAVVLLLATPGFPVYLFVTFYTLPVQALILATLLGASRVLVGDGPRGLAFTVGALLALCWTRSLYPPAFCALFWAGLLLCYHRIHGRNLPRGYRPASVVLALGLVAWPAKNWLVFGHFTSSSFDGFNLTRQLPETPAFVSLMGHMNRGEWVENAALAEATRDLQTRWAGWDLRPVLARQKHSGGQNWNHLVMLIYRRQLLEHAWKWRRENKSEVFMDAISNYQYWTAPTASTGAIVMPSLGEPGTIAAPWEAWAGAFHAVHFVNLKPPLAWLSTRLVEGGGPEDPEEQQGLIVRWVHRARDPLQLFAVLFPLVLVLHLVGLVRRRRDWGPRDGLRVLVLVAMAWSCLVPVFSDGWEGSRMRFTTLPLYYAMAAYLLVAGYRRIRGGTGLAE
jgi:hypothetical protein